MIELGVNIDHVATLRQARRERDPDLIAAAKICELAGAHQITVHLRQDRRHIQDRDIELLKDVLQVRMNFEMGATDEIINIAHRIKPECVCLVPENRQEVTTEGGLDVAKDIPRLKEIVSGFKASGIKVSMFIDPEIKQVDASAAVGADYVELHTGAYSIAADNDKMHEIDRIVKAAAHAIGCGIVFNAGHGLNRHNLVPIASIPGLNEVNIGHSIISRALFIGLDAAVSEILDVLHHCSS